MFSAALCNCKLRLRLPTRLQFSLSGFFENKAFLEEENGT
jgi:hypothetical protein